eukprot:CAMPEP_0205946782 /NCGR_PEP_ID=MMETSP1325-20131115/69223_1 /ASSEMBLY_ACC=CAM_ASM_000708 /TAXON_ID=236786 /ORGANISM="Florenciella sp., Strain RCC1007" /LENGTH=160 /DNA_ID=CAMNT_0053317871 /DNA_START=234 /DNA_END=714 /DNA_ORIENTATION=-
MTSDGMIFVSRRARELQTLAATRVSDFKFQMSRRDRASFASRTGVGSTGDGLMLPRATEATMGGRAFAPPGGRVGGTAARGCAGFRGYGCTSSATERIISGGSSGGPPRDATGLSSGGRDGGREADAGQYASTWGAASFLHWGTARVGGSQARSGAAPLW